MDGSKKSLSENNERILLRNRRSIDFSEAPLIMGILNSTPDSFFSESRSNGMGKEKAREIIDNGADILDIGGESTRPGSEYVSTEEELERVIPLIEAVRSFSDIPVSIDTRKKEVAKAALKAGADIINDISALMDDPEMADLAAEKDVPVILMHMRGNPKTMQKNPHYRDVINEIIDELEVSINNALKKGIKNEKIIIDPGIGFGKRFEDNLRIIHDLKKIKEIGFPLLMGLSRKSFIGEILKNTPGIEVANRLAGTITANVLSVLNGADILRVHDVGAARDMIKVIKAIGAEGNL